MIMTFSCVMNLFSQDNLFLDGDGGGYFNTPGEDPSVLLRVKEDHDGAEPSGNSVSAINLIRLSSMVEGGKSSYYRETADHLLVIIFCRICLYCCKHEYTNVRNRKERRRTITLEIKKIINLVHKPRRTEVRAICLWVTEQVMLYPGSVILNSQ